MGVREIRKWYVVVMVMTQILSWICATSRPIDSNHDSFHPVTITSGPAEIIRSQDAYHSSSRPSKKPNENKEIEETEKGRRIGSRPPSCEKKCYGCEPCVAIQVPTSSSIPHLSPHYANYQPEGWRCHCAP